MKEQSNCIECDGGRSSWNGTLIHEINCVEIGHEHKADSLAAEASGDLFQLLDGVPWIGTTVAGDLAGKVERLVREAALVAQRS